MQRNEMLDEIAYDALSTAACSGKSRIAQRVLDAMGRVDRERFVPDSLAPLAYLNRPLPIDCGQTISQPFIVALMTDLLRIEPGDRVLEIGTGSGYQAAVLAQMGAEVYSVEIIETLSRQAEARFRANGYDKINTRIGDGYYGWPEAAPFDGIIVTAAAPRVPDALIEQMKAGARLVIPLGPAWLTQSLMLIEKRRDGTLLRREVLPVSFVPLTGTH